jgi:sugar phosphate isomerase/epimerase
MLTEIASLGFEFAELSHGIRITLVPGILQALEEGVIRISSTHNFCPLPTGILHAAPNLFEPSSRDHREYDQWLRHTRRSIEFAAQVKSQVVVCHLGSVKFFWFNPAQKVRRYLRVHPEAGRNAADAAYAALLEKSRLALRKQMPPYWAQVRAGIAALVDYAREKGVQLGFENRERMDELPFDADIAEWLNAFPAGAPVGYWHDTGHADIKEGMGLLRHREHLAELAPRLLGFHLHDVNAQGQDHQAIGDGHIDFEMVSRFWRPEHRLTLELSPRATVEQVRESKSRLEALLQ